MERIMSEENSLIHFLQILPKKDEYLLQVQRLT